MRESCIQRTQSPQHSSSWQTDPRQARGPSGYIALLRRAHLMLLCGEGLLGEAAWGGRGHIHASHGRGQGRRPQHGSRAHHGRGAPQAHAWPCRGLIPPGLAPPASRRGCHRWRFPRRPPGRCTAVRLCKGAWSSGLPISHLHPIAEACRRSDGTPLRQQCQSAGDGI